MANKPKHAKEKRAEPEKRQNAQGDHEGSAHTPDEFDALNPKKQGPGKEKAGTQPGTSEDEGFVRGEPRGSGPR